MNSIWDIKTEQENDVIQIPFLDLKDNPGEMELAIPHSIGKSVKDYVNEMKRSNQNITNNAKLALDYIQAAEKGIDYVNNNRGIFKRIWGAITGKTSNKKLQTAQDLVNSQKACVQMIAEMNKQFLLGQEQILMLENVLHYMVNEENDFRKMLLDRLNAIFKSITKRFELVESTINKTITELKKQGDDINFHQKVLEAVDKKLQEHSFDINTLQNKTDFLYDYIVRIENEVHTLNWLSKLDSYNSPYEKIDNQIEKFFFAIFQFFDEKQGQFTSGDLLLFSSGLKKIGFDINHKITIEEFLINFIQEFSVKGKYNIIHKKLNFTNSIDEIKEGYYVENNNKTPFLTALNFCTFTQKAEDVLDVSIEKSIKNLDKLQINQSMGLDWFLMANEILAHLKLINNIQDITVNEEFVYPNNFEESNTKLNHSKQNKKYILMENGDWYWEADNDLDNNWESVGVFGVQKFNVDFDKPFTEAPNVHLSISGIDSEHKTNLRINLEPTNITKNGFTIKAKSWADTKIYRIKISWLAYVN